MSGTLGVMPLGETATDRKPAQTTTTGMIKLPGQLALVPEHTRIHTDDCVAVTCFVVDAVSLGHWASMISTAGVERPSTLVGDATLVHAGNLEKNSMQLTTPVWFWGRLLRNREAVTVAQFSEQLPLSTGGAPPQRCPGKLRERVPSNRNFCRILKSELLLLLPLF
jgi:hypothetical protein